MQTNEGSVIILSISVSLCEYWLVDNVGNYIVVFLNAVPLSIIPLYVVKDCLIPENIWFFISASAQKKMAIYPKAIYLFNEIHIKNIIQFFID